MNRCPAPDDVLDFIEFVQQQNDRGFWFARTLYERFGRVGSIVYDASRMRFAWWWEGAVYDEAGDASQRISEYLPLDVIRHREPERYRALMEETGRERA